MRRHGAVLVFRPGVTKEQAAAALASITAVLDTPATTDYLVPVSPGARDLTWKERPFTHADLVRDFDSEHGSPVWYIP